MREKLEEDREWGKGVERGFTYSFSPTFQFIFKILRQTVTVISRGMCIQVLRKAIDA